MLGLVSANARPPNIVLILADDMGYSDVGCFGGEIPTPRIDALAQGGIRFTQFYNTARCCPTRASLLTGLYPHQTGFGWMTVDQGLDGYRGELNRQSVTIAEVLRSSGYRTYLAGKWHVTSHVTPTREEDKFNWPRQRGFDRFYGTIHGAGSFFDPNSLTRDNAFISPYSDPEYFTNDFYYTDAITDHAVRFIAEHARDHRERPFFLYVAHTAPHWPMHAREADIAKFKGKYDAGYDATRRARLARMKELGIIDPRWDLSPQSGGAWNDVSNPEFERRCMEVYAAMMVRLDDGVGQVMEALKRAGMDDNTLVIFLSDNGAAAETQGRRGAFQPRASAPTLPPLPADYLQPDMIPKQTRDGYPVRSGYGVLPGAPDTYVSYGGGWANVSNTPFREYKHWVHEGGISTPLIVHWPAGIPTSRRGTLETQPGHVIDLMATCVDLAGAVYPKTHHGYDIQPLEGVSLLPAVRGDRLARSQPIFFEHEGNRAVRDGQWKLVAKGPDGAWELYDMETDRTEMNDLAAAHPEQVRRLAMAWEKWALRTAALPWPWQPAYAPAADPARK